MKKLFLLTLTLFLFGCDPVEQDTRLICDCDYVRRYNMFGDVAESPIQTCFEALEENNKNNSLVFNESKNKFVFGGVNFPNDYLEFSTDKIIYELKREDWRKYNVLDRISLVFSISDQRLDRIFTDNDGNETPFWKPEVTIFYNCRLTDGV